MADWLFWPLAWAAATTSGILRAFIDRRYSSIADLVALGCYGGIIGVGLVAVLVGTAGGHTGNEPWFLGVALIIGSLGKEQDQLVRWIVHRIFNTIGIEGDGEQELRGGLVDDDSRGNGSNLASDGDPEHTQ